MELRELLAVTVCEIRDRRMDARTASALASVCNVLVRVQDVALEERIAALERKAREREEVTR
jgi:hypothetical protein